MTLGSLTAYLLDRFLPSVPYTAVILVEGIALSIVSDATATLDREGMANAGGLGLLSRSLFMWQNINPELLLIVFLPPLLFADCFSMTVVRDAVLPVIPVAQHPC